MASREKNGPILGCAIPIALVIAAAGVALLMYSWDLTQSEANAVCGSSVMEEGQTCMVGSGEGAVHRSADDMRSGENAAQKIFGWAGVLAGGAIALGGGALMVAVIRNRNDD
ncbi:hypothetical protein [Streptomyces sp. V2I9]|uniref:hypothetical protein n=1 Tax=Streptomyces sp. V2I9 TaxID=3042304 RepID=UPI0027D8476C|nr:hypothetical protein [Streptomyces sp. V2I9]